MSIENVKLFFKQYGMESRIREFTVSSATVALAAEALHCEPCRIAKTLSFKVNNSPILIVTAGDAKIDNAKYKAQFGAKAKMLSPDEVPALIGHSIGGVAVYLDQSLKRFQTVFPACGSSNSAIELTIEELETYSDFSEWIDVCKEWD